MRRKLPLEKGENDFDKDFSTLATLLISPSMLVVASELQVGSLLVE